MAVNPWEPPEDVTVLGAAQRVAFGLVCAEHLHPSFALQVRVHPASLPAGALSPSDYRGCLDALWAWVGHREGSPPDCLTDEHARAAEEGEGAAIEGLFVLVTYAASTLALARAAYDQAHDGMNAGGQALNAVGEIADAVLGPRPTLPAPADIDESKRIQYERLDAMARHEVVQTERAAQAEAVATLAAGTDPIELREPAQEVGARIAEWTAQAL